MKTTRAIKFTLSMHKFTTYSALDILADGILVELVDNNAEKRFRGVGWESGDTTKGRGRYENHRRGSPDEIAGGTAGGSNAVAGGHS